MPSPVRIRRGSAAPGLLAFSAFCLIAAGCLSPDAFFLPTQGRPLDAPARSAAPRAGDPSTYSGYDFRAVDERAKAVPKAAAASPRTLVEYLSAGAKNDVEKVRGIFIWLAENIAYDGESYSVMDIKKRDADEVFIQKKGVCIDYSVLFESLCSRAGIPVKVITGHATGYPASIFLGDTRHAWNAVRIGGEWYLVDVTWSAGYLDQAFRFHKAAEHDSFWLSQPAAFARSHHPEDPVWQLLSPPMKWEEFMELAKRGG